jgi:predicted nucleotidyltransferase
MTVEEWTFASDAETLVQLQPTRKLLHIVLFKQELLQISKFSKKKKSGLGSG